MGVTSSASTVADTESEEPIPNIELLDPDIKDIMRIKTPIGQDIDVNGNDDDVALENIDNLLEFQQINCESTTKGSQGTFARTSWNTALVYDEDEDDMDTQIITDLPTPLPVLKNNEQDEANDNEDSVKL